MALLPSPWGPLTGPTPYRDPLQGPLTGPPRGRQRQVAPRALRSLSSQAELGFGARLLLGFWLDLALALAGFEDRPEEPTPGSAPGIRSFPGINED